jgi:23S rRNA pseudouridine2605 synthase
MRLQKFLAQAGVASRRRAEALIKAGAVSVNGAVVDSLGVTVNSNDTVEVEGQRARLAAAEYRLLLKPRECLSTLTDPKPSDRQAGGEIRDTLARYVRDREIGWHVVAPLDFQAEGVLLLTTDGELADRMSRGGGRVAMTYHIKFQGRVGDEEVGRLLRGWKFERRTVKPEAVTALATTGKNTWVEVVVAEARPRVIKAAGDPIRKSVLKISRTKLGPLSFEGLAMGEGRDLSKGEVGALRRAAGIGHETGRPERELKKESKVAKPLAGGDDVIKKRREQDGPRPAFGKRQDRPARARARAR